MPPASPAGTVSDLIHLMRLELIRADALRRQHGLPPAFAVESMELEVQAVAERTTGDEGGWNLRVLSARDETGDKSGQTHTIRLRLTALQSEREAARKLPVGILQAPEG